MKPRDCSVVKPWRDGTIPEVDVSAKARSIAVSATLSFQSLLRRRTCGVIGPSRQTIAAVAVWTAVHWAVRFMYLMILEAAVNRAAVDAQNLRSADLVATGVCDRTAN